MEEEKIRKGASKFLTFLAETFDDPTPRLILQFANITPVSIETIASELKKDVPTIKPYIEKLVEFHFLNLRLDNRYEISETGKIILDKDFIKTYNEIIDFAIEYVKSLYDK